MVAANGARTYARAVDSLDPAGLEFADQLGRYQARGRVFALSVLLACLVDDDDAGPEQSGVHAVASVPLTSTTAMKQQDLPGAW